MKTETCTDCGGKGYHYKLGHILSRADGRTVADTHTRGAMCDKCNGTGLVRVINAWDLTAWTVAAIAVFLLIAIL